MQNLINELEQGSVLRSVTNLDLRAARAIRELAVAYEQANAFRMKHQDIEFGESLQDCRFIINEVASKESLECIS